jgi:hypothetical protein
MNTTTNAGLTYTEAKGWTGGDDRTLYLVTDKRTGRTLVRPGYLLKGIGPVADIRVATRNEAMQGWQSPLHAGWTVREAA